MHCIFFCVGSPHGQIYQFPGFSLIQEFLVDLILVDSELVLDQLLEELLSNLNFGFLGLTLLATPGEIGGFDEIGANVSIE